MVPDRNPRTECGCQPVAFMSSFELAPPGRFIRSRILRSEEHTSELQSRPHLVCRLLLEKKKKDQVNAHNEMLPCHKKESTACVANIMENTTLYKQQQVSEIMRQMLTQAQTAGQYFTNDQIKEMIRKVSAEVDLVHQQTQNQRYGSSHIGATAKDISNVVTDAASGVVDIFHGTDKAVADTWNNFWKDGKADGIGSNLSRK